MNNLRQWCIKYLYETKCGDIVLINIYSELNNNTNIDNNIFNYILFPYYMSYKNNIIHIHYHDVCLIGRLKSLLNILEIYNYTVPALIINYDNCCIKHILRTTRNLDDIKIIINNKVLLDITIIEFEILQLFDDDHPNGVKLYNIFKSYGYDIHDFFDCDIFI